MKKLWNDIKQLIAGRRIQKQLGEKAGEGLKFIRRFFFIFNKYLAIFGGALLIYLILLVLLVYVERGAPGARIHNIEHAVWYSLATFTTVGYGDFYPVTPAGRAVASVFLILGIGLLGFFVGFMVEFIARIKPVLILSLNTGKPWYIFTDRSQYSVIFAQNLKKVRPDALIIYAGTRSDGDEADQSVSVSWDVNELLERRGSLYDAHIMCMKENEMDNFLDAVALADTGVPIICLAGFTPAHHPMNINFFSPSDCTARIFWQQYPVKKPSEKILLVGFGNAGKVLLDRALELNVLYDKQNICYHVFGESGEYCRNRKLLDRIVSLNKPSDSKDSVIFHDDLWNTNEELLREADRIVLCSDSEQENISILHKIQKFFVVSGSIYIYNSNVRSVATPFGQTSDVLTPAFVLHNRLSDMALCRHELFRFYSQSPDIPMWEDLNSLVKDMNYITTDHISMKVRMMLGEKAPAVPFDDLEPEVLREASGVYHALDEARRGIMLRIEHERSLRFYLLHNFRYGEKIDDEERVNPLIKPFDELSDKEKNLSETAWALLDELASHKEARRGR